MSSDIGCFCYIKSIDNETTKASIGRSRRNQIDSIIKVAPLIRSFLMACLYSVITAILQSSLFHITAMK